LGQRLALVNTVDVLGPATVFFEALKYYTRMYTRGCFV
jgi:hypothetical protein